VVVSGGGAATTATTTIYIVRYGLTEFPLVENEGPFDSDIDPSSGIEHANAIASRLAADISSSLSSTSRKDINIMVFSSPFLRTCHTASIISAKVSSALESTVAVKIEEGLTEWQIPSLLVTPDGTKTEPRTVAQLAKLFPNIIDSSYTSVNPFQDDWFPESQDRLLQRCGKTLQALLLLQQQASSSGNEEADHNNIMILVSHAPCDQALALYLEGNWTSPEQSHLTAWPLGGITKFTARASSIIEGTTNHDEATSHNKNKWTMEWYGDSQHVSITRLVHICTYLR
jgi:broad specificity phosphatase PhoE